MRSSGSRSLAAFHGSIGQVLLRKQQVNGTRAGSAWPPVLQGDHHALLLAGRGSGPGRGGAPSGSGCRPMVRARARRCQKLKDIEQMESSGWEAISNSASTGALTCSQAGAWLRGLAQHARRKPAPTPQQAPLHSRHGKSWQTMPRHPCHPPAREALGRTRALTHTCVARGNTGSRTLPAHTQEHPLHMHTRFPPGHRHCILTPHPPAALPLR